MSEHNGGRPPLQESRADHTCALNGQELAGDASPDDGLAIEGWRVIPAAASCCAVVADRVVAEEEEDVVAEDGAADSAAKLVVTCSVAIA